MPITSTELERVLLDASLLRDFRRKLLTDPVETLRGRGVDIPDGVEIRIVEDDLRSVTIPIPPFVGRNIAANSLNEEFADNDWTACTLCVLTSIICTAGTTTSIIVATQD
ncbi:hypothetical protein [Marivita sp. GX14005]|uniref:hypothetical protein n=1 Tax=Marivita sp. GX14005 TaxID=2942276 RepID=UPI0020195D51|nr:hypothetical protein [Marivita sp. GX14005]MCL3882222.1 hypothetical protein [Marivita sp. GX14005]